MKIDPVSMSLILIITITMVRAQRYTRLNKPIIDLNSKHQVTSPKLPEERRKLSIFPKSKVKYVVTSKPYSKVRTYSPYQVTTKRPVMQPILPKEIKNIRTTAVMKAPTITTQLTTKRQLNPRFQLSTRPPVVQIPEDTDFYENEEDSYMSEPSTRYNVAYNKENHLSDFDEKYYADEVEADNADTQLTSNATDKPESIDEIYDLDAVESNDSSKVNVNKILEQSNDENINKTFVQEESVNIKNESGDIREDIKEKEISENEKEIASEYEKEEVNMELDIKGLLNKETQNEGIKNLDEDTTESKYEETESKEIEKSIRKKRLTVLGRSVYNKIEEGENKPTNKDMSAMVDSDATSESSDNNEFIFIRDYLQAPVDIKKSSNYIASEFEDSVEIATEIAWLEEYVYRPERSINVIEEENLGTTMSSFKFTGREPRVDSDLVFRNINA